MRIFLLLFTLLLSACGFQLRGEAGMPFTTLYLEAANPNTAMIADLRRILEFNKVHLVNSAEQAEVILNIVSEYPNKQILTLGGSGRVTEFQLNYKVSLRAYDLKRNDWIPAEEMVLRREYSYDDTKILAKEQEEAMIYQNLRSDMVQQIVRRLSRAEPHPQD